MIHYKSMYDPGEYLECADLAGKEVTVEIESVAAGKIGRGGKESRKPMVTMVGAKKKFALNKTNGRTIAKLYGPDVSNWRGKLITLYGTTTQFGGETVECVRVKPVVPEKKRGKSDVPAAMQAGSDDASGDEVQQ